MGTYRLEERLMRVLGPILGDQQREIAAPDIDRPMEHALACSPLIGTALARRWDHSSYTAEVSP